jgi:hypothetical protein
MSTIPSPRRQIPMALFCAEIASHIGSPPSVGRRKLQQLAADARLPGAHTVNGRWFIYADAVPEVIAALGITAPEGVSN